MATAEFDQIADAYDETRRALDKQTLDGINEMLARHKCHSILEIGVGTGRVSLPLSRNGYEMTGVDISRRMMEKAKLKGLRSLILANGIEVPFKNGSFEATIMAHVFHLLEDPLSVMREAARVSRVGVFALVRKREGNRPWSSFFGRDDFAAGEGNVDETTKNIVEERRERFRKIAEKYGWSRDSARHYRNWKKESEILETHPPDDLKVASDVVINDSLEERISRFEKAAHVFVLRMPEEMRKEIVSEMRASPPQWQAQPRHEIYEIAMWKSDGLLR